MTPRQRAIVRSFVILVAIGATLCQAALPAVGAGSAQRGANAYRTGSLVGAGSIASASGPTSTSGSGGAGILSAALGPVAATPAHVPAPPGKRAKGRWLRGVAITEYWPALESWFVGEMVQAPGLPDLHRIDWLYSAAGVSMQGAGVGLNGRTYHIDALGYGGWVTATGTATSPSDGWSAGAPYWRAGGYWRNSEGQVTFPLGAGGWSHGAGAGYVPLHGVSFAPGSSLPLRYDQSLAVDPGVIALGSRVFVPAYRNDGHGGWFIAQDTGGAITGRHIDVYRSPPANPFDTGQSLASQRIFVVKPKH